MNESPCVLISYFSGTSGTERIADEFYRQLRVSTNAEIQSLDLKHRANNKEQIIGLLPGIRTVILLFCVHEMDAPKPIFEWIDDFPDNMHIPIAVISVSGGGEAWPNKSSRANCIIALERKGFVVFYEKMMMMPSNILMYTNADAAMWLINCIPTMVGKMIGQINSGKMVRDEVRKKFRTFSTASDTYEKYCRKCSKGFFITAECTKCNWCVQSCSRSNISNIDGKIVFGDNCILCLRCIYGCPQNAINSKSHFGLLKKGFSLNKLEEKMQDRVLRPIEKCCKGVLWIGVKRYLFEVYEK